MTAMNWKVAALLIAAVGLLAALGSGVAQDVPKPDTSLPPANSNKRDLVTGPYDNMYTGVTEKFPLQGATKKEGYSFLDWDFHCMMLAPNQTVARVVYTEAKYQYEWFSAIWFGGIRKVQFIGPPERTPLDLMIRINATGKMDDKSEMQHDDWGNVKAAQINLTGPLESILSVQLPCEIAHVVLAENFNSKMPRWADDGLVLSTTLPEYQAQADVALRQYVNAGKAIKLKPCSI